MALTYFDVTGTIKAAVSNSSSDIDGDPQLQFVTAFVDFIPSVRQVFSVEDGVLYRLQDIRGRTSDVDGTLETIDGSTLTLPANSSVLDLPELRYRVKFSNVTYDGLKDQVIDSFEFVAPTDSTPVDLATVARV